MKDLTSCIKEFGLRPKGIGVLMQQKQMKVFKQENEKE